MRGWQAFVQDPPADAHVAIVYKDDAFLARGVASWVAPSLKTGGGAILVGTVSHLELVREELRRAGVDLDAADRSGRFLALDADWLMAHFVLDGSPDGAKFAALARDIVGRTQAACGGRPVRAWGEMVCLLRHRGNAAAAARLEELWNEVIEAYGITLLCSYAMEEPEAESPGGGLMGSVLAAHSHVLPQPGPGRPDVLIVRDA